MEAVVESEEWREKQEKFDKTVKQVAPQRTERAKGWVRGEDESGWEGDGGETDERKDVSGGLTVSPATARGGARSVAIEATSSSRPTFLAEHQLSTQNSLGLASYEIDSVKQTWR